MRALYYPSLADWGGTKFIIWFKAGSIPARRIKGYESVRMAKPYVIIDCIKSSMNNI